MQTKKRTYVNFMWPKPTINGEILLRHWLTKNTLYAKLGYLPMGQIYGFMKPKKWNSLVWYETHLKKYDINLKTLQRPFDKERNPMLLATRTWETGDLRDQMWPVGQMLTPVESKELSSIQLNVIVTVLQGSKQDTSRIFFKLMREYKFKYHTIRGEGPEYIYADQSVLLLDDFYGWLTYPTLKTLIDSGFEMVFIRTQLPWNKWYNVSVPHLYGIIDNIYICDQAAEPYKKKNNTPLYKINDF